MRRSGIVLVLLLAGCAGHTFVPVTGVRGCWEFKDPADSTSKNYRLIGMCAESPAATLDAGAIPSALHGLKTLK